MALGDLAFNRLPEQHQSLESLKKKYKERLDAILYRQLTVENIETFADNALEETIKLTDDILGEYRKNPNVKASPTTLDTKTQENEAYAIFGLPNIPEILENIIKIKDSINNLKTYIANNLVNVDIVNTPPQTSSELHIVAGNGGFEKKKIFPRLLTLFYILKHDFDITPTPENVQPEKSRVTPEMVRRTPYVRIEIPDLNRAVYICDEEDNRSFVFDIKKVVKVGLALDDIDLQNKGDKDSLIAHYPGIGIPIRQSKNWRIYIAEALREEIKNRTAEEAAKVAISKDSTPEVSKGELDPWRGLWTNPADGKHWGTRRSIARKLDRTYNIFEKRIPDPRLTKIEIIDMSNRIQDGYCFEKIIELFPELRKEEFAEKEGEWRWFWLDPETKKHWGPLRALEAKFNINHITVERYVKKYGLVSREIQGTSGRPLSTYCYEDLMEIETFLDLLTAPQVNKEGEWLGFYIDGEKRHWANVSTLGPYFNVDNSTINLYAEKFGFPTINVKSRVEDVRKAYSLESFQQNKKFTEFLKLPKTETEGPWKNFWVSEDGTHWSTIAVISVRLHIGRRKLEKLILQNPTVLSSKDVKSVGGQQIKVYSLEEVEKKVNTAG